MIEWIDVGAKTPQEGKIYLCYCPDWCDIEYQVAYWCNEIGFYYHEQPNENFNSTVEKWAFVCDAD